MTARTWPMFAHHYGAKAGWMHVENHERTTRMYDSSEIHRVIAIEDETGDYMGWLYTGEDDRLVLVQRAILFDIQFTYGHRAEQERGKGQSVRLRIERAPASDEEVDDS